MPTDQNVNALQSETATVSAIENELPTYRAISPGAVVALICGILAILSFASWYFLAFSVAAIVVGVLAGRKIQKMPDVLTGNGIAQAGIALGLTFGLTAVTIGTVQSALRERQAATFGQAYEKVLSKGSLNDLLFYNQPPNMRKNTTPDQLVNDMKKAGDKSPMADMQAAPFREVKARLNEPGADIHFSKIESHNDDGRMLYAAALYDVHLPNRSTPGDKDAFLLAVMKGMKNEKGVYEWWVEDVRFPYKPASYVPPTKPVDDGHGHGEDSH